MVGIADEQFDHGAGFDAERVEIFEEAAVAFEDADDGGLTSWGEFVEGNETAVVSILARFQAECEAMRAVLVVPEFFG